MRASASAHCAENHGRDNFAVVALPLEPPLEPQLARGRAALPDDDGWRYEPKYDGFRALAFVDGDEVYLQSRGKRPLRRYFPELSFPPGRYVLDGEIIIGDVEGTQDFDALQNRLHPAESRVNMLAESTPSTYVAFDLLARDDESLLERPFSERRAALEKLVGDPVRLAPSVATAAEAEAWLHSAEGVIAKLVDSPYRPGKRDGMVKVKRVRTMDCVVVGWRPGKEEGTVGSLILGLYDEGGKLHVIGHTSGLKAAQKRELVGELAPFETGERGHGDPSRWATERDLEWVSLRPELVVEVSYDHASNGRIRHGTKLLRWREDKPPKELLARPAGRRRKLGVELFGPPLPRAGGALARCGRPALGLRIAPAAAGRLRVAHAPGLRLLLRAVGIAAGRDALGLALLLGEVRRPGRVAQATPPRRGGPGRAASPACRDGRRCPPTGRPPS